MRLADSELILNPDGSIYHLQLKPGEVAQTILTVGDQNRVAEISKHFDTLELVRRHREFVTHTGWYMGKMITVISTGIGPDNIDIVFNELDALFNIDFQNRTIKPNPTTLEFIRVGTSGALQPEIPLDSFVAGRIGIGFDNLIRFYSGVEEITLTDFPKPFMEHTQWNPKNAHPYAVSCNLELYEQMVSSDVLEGITTTNVGFYGPQGRSLRLGLHDPLMNEKLVSFRFKGKPITNLEMETAAMYAMAKLLGHKALSMNVILANRATGEFSQQPQASMERLIEFVLNRLTS